MLIATFKKFEHCWLKYRFLLKYLSRLYFFHGCFS